MAASRDCLASVEERLAGLSSVAEAVVQELGIPKGASLPDRVQGVVARTREIAQEALRFGTNRLFAQLRSHYIEIDLETASAGFNSKIAGEGPDKLDELVDQLEVETKATANAFVELMADHAIVFRPDE